MYSLRIKEVQFQLYDSKVRVKRAYKNAYAEWLKFRRSFENKAEQEQEQILIGNLTYDNIQKMRQLSSHFFQKVEILVDQDQKTEEELTKILLMTKQWVSYAETYFQGYGKVIPLMKSHVATGQMQMHKDFKAA